MTTRLAWPLPLPGSDAPLGLVARPVGVQASRPLSVRPAPGDRYRPVDHEDRLDQLPRGQRPPEETAPWRCRWRRPNWLLGLSADDQRQLLRCDLLAGAAPDGRLRRAWLATVGGWGAVRLRLLDGGPLPAPPPCLDGVYGDDAAGPPPREATVTDRLRLVGAGDGSVDPPGVNGGATGPDRQPPRPEDATGPDRQPPRPLWTPEASDRDAGGLGSPLDPATLRARLGHYHSFAIAGWLLPQPGKAASPLTPGGSTGPRGPLVGYAAAAQVGQTLWLDRLAVHPAVRGLGVGRRLAEALLGWAVKDWHTRVAVPVRAGSLSALAWVRDVLAATALLAEWAGPSANEVGGWFACPIGDGIVFEWRRPAAKLPAASPQPGARRDRRQG